MSNEIYTYQGPRSLGHGCSFVSQYNEQFKIEKIENATGMPGVMILFVNNTPSASFTFNTAYINKPFEFIDKNGNSHSGIVSFGKVYLE